MTLFRPEVFQAKKNRWTGQIVLVRPFHEMTIMAAYKHDYSPKLN